MEIALGLLSLVMSAIAFWFACKSDKKMQAIADLNFDEKLAMFAGYLERADSNLSVQRIERLRNDFLAVSNLHRYASQSKKELLIKGYIIPIIEKLIANQNLKKESIIPINQIVDDAINYKIDTQIVEGFKNQLRGLKKP
ncbi:MAG: hypothetical protein ACMUJM_19980 [bacterium]